MYEGWEVERWDTPVSDVESLRMVELVDDGELRVTLESQDGRRFRFAFGPTPAYRNIREEYRLELWEDVFSRTGTQGWTRTVPRSKWLKHLVKHEPVLADESDGLTHYMLIGDDVIVEVLAGGEPRITEVSPATTVGASA